MKEAEFLGRGDKMYILQVETNMQELIAFLDTEATQVKPLTYSFVHPEFAYKMLSRFMFYQLRESEIASLIVSRRLTTSQKDDFVLSISSEDIVDILHGITEKLAIFLAGGPVFPFDGFFHFRLSEEKQKIKDSLQEALKVFRTNEMGQSNMDSLHDILRNETTKESEVYILIEPNKRVILRSQDKVYLVDSLYNEDVLLSHLIILAPVTVKVFETHGELTKETVIILKHLFRDKVGFTREKYPEYRHSKE